jgi:O-acetyl-ADP-ribose deacetylase (regulator of RNase III)
VEFKTGNSKLVLKQGDIVREETEAIVNAANESLLGGGGVDGAIHRVGGPQILEECRKIGGCITGNAVITGGGKLRARHVIHTVGPVYRGGGRGEPELLASCYRRSLEVASAQGIKTLSFPSISTGAYGYPIEKASRIALKTVADYLKGHPEIQEVRFVLFSSKELEVYKNAIKDAGLE